MSWARRQATETEEPAVRTRVLLITGFVLAASVAASIAPATASEHAADWRWSQEDPASSPANNPDVDLYYDTRRDEVVLSVAHKRAGVETWVWDGTTWEERAVGADRPPRRQGSAIAYDEQRGYAILYGGNRGSSGSTTSTWVFDGDGWTKLDPPRNPGGRFNPSMAYDPHLGQVILFGGKRGVTGFRDDTWTWTGRTWKRLHPAASPSPRFEAGLALDRSRGSLVLHGGFPFTDSTWTWDGRTWVELDLAAAPPPRAWPAMSSMGDRVMVFGGLDPEFDAMDDTWVLGDAGWTELVGLGPQARVGATAAFDRQRREVVLFGGRPSGAPITDQWTLSRHQVDSPGR